MDVPEELHDVLQRFREKARVFNALCDGQPDGLCSECSARVIAWLEGLHTAWSEAVSILDAAISTAERRAPVKTSAEAVAS